MKKIMYIHGAFSAYKPESEKVLALKKEFNVVGISYSMEKTFQENHDMFKEYAIKENIDFVVGTSLGGYYAASVASELDIPSVLINPATNPAGTIDKLIGEQKNYTTGENEVFTQSLADSFPDVNYINDKTIVFVGLKDDIIDPQITIETSKKSGATVITSKDDDHYWEFFEDNNSIKNFLNTKL